MAAGDKIKITTDDKYMEKCSKSVLWVDYKNITQVMSVGARMFIDDGLISVIVKEMGESAKKQSKIWRSLHKKAQRNGGVSLKMVKDYVKCKL